MDAQGIRNTAANRTAGHGLLDRCFILMVAEILLFPDEFLLDCTPPLEVRNVLADSRHLDGFADTVSFIAGVLPAQFRASGREGNLAGCAGR